MSKVPIVPPHMQDIDPNQTKRRKLESSGKIQKSAKNPEGKSMHEFVGTPQKTEAELEEAKLIQDNIRRGQMAVSYADKVKRLLSANRSDETLADVKAFIEKHS